MIFRRGCKPELIDNIALHHYYPYRVWDGGQTVVNPKFDGTSGLILDVKMREDPGVPHFRKLLDEVLQPNISIAVVPSHDPKETIAGIGSFAQGLAKNNRVDATACLRRTKLVKKLATGGSRDIQVHLNSIVVRKANLIRDKEVFLLDDVTTSGNSLKACRRLLRDAGAARVEMLALGKTTH